MSTGSRMLRPVAALAPVLAAIVAIAVAAPAGAANFDNVKGFDGSKLAGHSCAGHAGKYAIKVVFSANGSSLGGELFATNSGTSYGQLIDLQVDGTKVTFSSANNRKYDLTAGGSGNATELNGTVEFRYASKTQGNTRSEAVHLTCL